MPCAAWFLSRIHRQISHGYQAQQNSKLRQGHQRRRRERGWVEITRRCDTVAQMCALVIVLQSIRWSCDDTVLSHWPGWEGSENTGTLVQYLGGGVYTRQWRRVKYFTTPLDVSQVVW